MLDYTKYGSENNLYENTISYLAFNLRKDGYIVKINSINNLNESSYKFKGFTPNLYAKKNGRELIVKIETCKNIKRSNNRLKLQRFGFKSRMDFYLFVPAKCVHILTYQIKIMGLSADVFSIEDVNVLSSDKRDYIIKKILKKN